MATPLEKARQNPDSMKGKILASARKLFGEYGFHGTTTRMIAKDVGIDISTLYYHWGEKGDLYEAVVWDINEGLRLKLIEVENKIKNRPLEERIRLAIDEMVDYLFEIPEISNMIIFRYFTKNRHESSFDTTVPEYISNIAFSMGLTEKKKNVPSETQMKILMIMNSIHSFVSGENFFLNLLQIDRKAYVKQVKDTLIFHYIPAYSGMDAAVSK